MFAEPRSDQISNRGDFGGKFLECGGEWRGQSGLFQYKMGVDKRGIKRGACIECGQCDDYETPKDGHDCDYCGCKPPKHPANDAEVTFLIKSQQKQTFSG